MTFFRRVSMAAGGALLVAGVTLYANGQPAVTPVNAPLNLGSANVCPSGQTTPAPCSQTATMTFKFTAGGLIGAPAVLTQGAPKLDFTDAGTGTCTTHGTAYVYSANETCTVDVKFAPRHPGARYGAAELLDGSGKLVAMGYVMGTGLGPLSTFAKTTGDGYAPSYQSTLASGSGGPNGVMVDSSGNVFVTNLVNNAVAEIVAVNGTIPASPTINTVASGFSWPYGVAMDGAGNLFVGDRGNSAVKEIVAAGGYTTVQTLGSGFSGPNGVAVDGSGNVFVADWNKGAVYEIVAASGYTTVRTLGNFGLADYVAVDGNGNVFVADFSNSVKEIVAVNGSIPASPTIRTLGGGLSAISCVAVDASGNLFVTEWSAGTAAEIFAAGGYTTVKGMASGFDRPNGLTVDAGGDVIVADQGGRQLVTLDYADPPSLSFASTVAGSSSKDSPQIVTVANGGNQDLHILGLSYPEDFPQAPGVSTDCTSSTTLSPGESCTLSIDFSPLVASATRSSTPLNETIRLTTNHLNGSAVVQSIAVNGTVTSVPPIGWISYAGDSSNGASTVGHSDNLMVAGVAADPRQGAPVSQVQVLIDGSVVGNAALGAARPDVAARYNNPAYTNSGWTLSTSVSGLSLGTHTVGAIATNSLGLSTTFASKTFTVAANSSGPPIGWINSIEDSSTGGSTVGQSGQVLVTGVAADPQQGAPVSQVQVLIDGNVAGSATLGMARPDIAASFNNPAYTNSGWRFTTSATGLSLGTHTVSAIGTDFLSLSTTFGSKTFTVAANSSGPPIGWISQAVDRAGHSTTIPHPGNLLVTGVAADPQQGAPVSQVQVLIDGNVAGNATLGLSRPDVAAMFGNPAYTNSGWTFTFAVFVLSTGTHTVTAIAQDSLGVSTTLGYRTISVQ